MIREVVVLARDLPERFETATSWRVRRPGGGEGGLVRVECMGHVVALGPDQRVRILSRPGAQ